MLKTLIKLRILEMFSGLRTKKGRSLGVAGMIILFFLAGLSFLFLFGTMAFALILGLGATDYKWLFFGIMAILSFMLSFIGTVFMTKQQMFEAKDNHALLSMPIKPRDILISRVLSIGIMDYALCLLIAFPFGVIYAIFGRFTIAGALFYILGVLLIPLIALAFSIFLGWLIAALSNKFKYKNFVSLVFSTIFLGIYFYFCFSWQDRIEDLINHGEEVAQVLSKYLPPVYHFGNAAANGSLLSFIIFALICIVPFVIALVIVAKNFVKIITTERGAAKIEYKGGEMKSSSAFSALSSMELKRFTSSSMYMLNAGIGLLFVLFLSIFALVKKGELLTVLNEIGPFADYIVPVMIAALLYLSSFTIISSATISLDAKTLWIPKTLPIEEDKVLFAKAFPHIAISLPVMIVSSLILEFLFSASFISRIMLVLIPTVVTVFNALLGVIINLNVPKFNWINEAQAVKQGMAPFLAMILSAVPAVLFTLLAVLFGVTGIISMDVYLIIYLLIAVLGTYLQYRWLSRKGALKFRRLQNN